MNLQLRIFPLSADFHAFSDDLAPAPARAKNKAVGMRIGRKLTIAFSTVIFVSAIAGVASIYIAENAMKKDAGESALQLADDIIRDVDREIYVRVEDIQAYANDLLLAKDVVRSNKAFDKTPGIMDFIKKTDEDWKSKKQTPFITSVLNNELSEELVRYLDFYKQKYEYAPFSEVYVTNRYGVVLASTGRTSDYLQADERWYQEALKKRDFWLGDVEFDESSDAVSIDIVVNIYDRKGAFAGLLKGVLNIEAMKSIIDLAQTRSKYKSMEPRLLDKKGLVIFSGLDPTLKKQGKDIRLEEFGEDVSRLQGASDVLGGKSGFVFIPEEGMEILRTFSHSKGFSGLGWTVVMDFNADEILRPVRRVRNALLALFAVSPAFVVLMALMVSRSISRPIERLRNAALKFGAGEFGSRIELVSKDEIGELGAAFNKMAVDLQKITVSRNYVEKIFESMMDSLIVTTPEGAVSAVNKAALDMLGYVDDELLGRPILTIFEEQEKDFEELMKNGFIRNAEKTYLAKDGRKIPVLFSGSVMRGAGGALFGVVCAAHDITERKRVEEEIKVLAKFPSENPNPVLRIATDGTILYGNDASAPLLDEWGCEAGQSVPEALKQTVNEVYDSQKTKLLELKNKGRIFSMVVAPVAQSEYVNIYGTDVTEQRQATFEIKKLSAAIEQSSSIVFITDSDGVIEYVNPIFEQVTGYAKQEALGQTPRILSSGETPDSMYGEMWGTIKGGWTWRGILKNRTKDGGRYWCNTVISPVKDQNGNIINYLAVQEDITEKKASEAKIKYLAYHDEMTDLLNRSRFMELMGERLFSNLEDKEPGVLLMLDIDHFKFINDSYGHGLGDEVLRSVSRLLKKTLQDEESILGRLGGDEFAIYLAPTDEKKGMAIAERIREQIEGYRSGSLPFRLSASIGAVLYPVHGAAVSELFTKVDAAMYRAKELGRNRSHLYRDEDHILEDIHSRLKWKERILKALDEDRFEVWMQPIIGLNDNKVRHYEALARMRDEEGNILLPGAFIEVAERFDIIGAVDKQIIKKTLILMSEAGRKGRSLTFSINLSGKDLMDDDLLLFIRSAISETGADPDHIVFEITETAAVCDIERAARFIKALKSLGCHFSLDDFGVGFTSFTYLRELDVDYIKIDGSFIRNLKKNANDQLFVKAIADVARGMKVKSIAEFVESEETFQILKKLGVDYAQGYYIGKPEHLTF